MAELIRSLDAIADDLRCTWLKRVDANDCRQTVQTLLEIIEWLTHPGIHNAMTSAASSQPASYLTAPFLHVFRCLESCLYQCSRFPYNESTTNEWFSHPSDSELREQAVNVINVDKSGKASKCYTTQNQVANFPESLSDDDHEVFFHGTRHKYAQDIIENGIDVRKGCARQDFSNGDGFYFGDSFDEAWRWPESRGHPNSAVLVFRVKKTELQRENEKGLNLRGNNNKKRWQEVVSQFRSGRPDPKFVKSLRKYDFIEGPMASMSSKNPNLNYPRQKEGTYQLCVRKDSCAELFDRNLHSVVFFER